MSAAVPTGPFLSAWEARAVEHPLPLPVAPASDRAAWGPGGGVAGVQAASLAALAARAEALAAQPWPGTPASSYLRLCRDGDRVDYERRVAARQARLSLSAVTAAATADDRWLDDVIDGVVVLCEQSTWCWPAHDDAPAVSGSYLPDPRRPFLDLGAGEVVAQFAWVDRLLGSELDRRAPGLGQRIRHEASKRVFEPFTTRRDWHWLGTDGDVDNWNPWIHSNVVVAALALLDERDGRDDVIRAALGGIDNYIASLPDDGATDEGYSYWWNGACRALETAVLLAAVYPGLKIEPTAGLRATLDLPRHLHLGGPWFVSTGDARAHPDAEAPWHALFRSARAFDADEAAQFAASRRPARAPIATESEGLGRLLLALSDPEWAGADPTPPAPEQVVWLSSVQIGVARDAPADIGPERRGLTVVVKGGHNGEHHNHLDVGSVIVAVGGTPLVVDPGRPTYTKQTFSSSRYEIWTMQSGWHSVPAITGLEQGIGAQWRATGARCEHDPLATVFSLDLAGAYPLSPIGRWQRTVRLDRRAHCAVVHDAWDGIDHQQPTLWRCILAGTVSHERGALRVAGGADGAGGARAVLSWDPDLTSRVEVRSLDDPELASAWGPALSRLTITVPHTRSRAALTVTIGEAV